MSTLEYAGVCLQARQVGGDYYDFLDLGRERLGLVIGDIAGKGIAAPVCEYQLICASPVQIQKRDFKYHGMIPHILWTCRQRLPSSNQTTL